MTTNTKTPLLCTGLQATDELVSRGLRELPQFSVRIPPLAAYIQAHPATVIVDSLDKLQQVNLQTLLPHVITGGQPLAFWWHDAPATHG